MATSRFPREVTSRLPMGDGALPGWLPKLLTAAAVGLGAWLATEWFWYFSGATAMRPSAPTQLRQKINLPGTAETLAATQLFGAPKAAGPVVAQVSSLNIKLKGVFAGNPTRPAFAIVNTGTKDEYALAGKEFMPGVTLESVHATHVLVKRNGLTERVNLEERSLASAGGPRPSPVLMTPRPAPRVAPEPPPQPPAAPPAPPAGQAPGAAPGAMPQLPPGMGPQSSTHFGRIGQRADGVMVEAAPPGSVLANLGLQPGDVIRSVNGQTVSSGTDLARLYEQAASAQSISAEITRDGKTIPLQVTLRK